VCVGGRNVGFVVRSQDEGRGRPVVGILLAEFGLSRSHDEDWRVADVVFLWMCNEEGATGWLFLSGLRLQ
jgi:hypothetical protein